MAADSKSTKSGPTPKKTAAAKDKSVAETPKAKDKTTDKAADTTAEAPKAESSESAGAAPKNYSRGEGQKPVTQAYKDNWNAIFAKKKTKKR